MQQFVVPQFIDVEDKIFGPVTTRQFLILLVAGGIIYVVYELADFALFILLTFFIGRFALILAFVKINGQPFHYFLLNLIQSLRRPPLRIWKQEYDTKTLNFLRKQTFEMPEVEERRKQPKREHIRDLSLLVNTGGYYKPNDDNLV